MNSKMSSGLPLIQDISLFRNELMHWFENNQRDYPWRKTGDPFRVLIAEIMLRRTKADQVRDVYNKLFRKYPDVRSMAEADRKQLEQILYPLGLKWRTPAFGLVAREIREKYQYKVPQTREELMSLPGVGDYVAGAVLSMVYGEAEWIVDSNIVRLLKRYFGVRTSKEGRRDKHIIEMAKMYASGSDPRKANFAILDFAALICTLGKPHHDRCPLTTKCQYFLRTHHDTHPT